MTQPEKVISPFDGDSSWRRRIAVFLISQNLSLFGSSVVGYAILWHITLTTSSGAWMAWYTACAMLPAALISPWGGVLADRHNRKTLIMLSDSFIALATLGLALAYLSGFQRLELLLAASVVRSVGSGIQTPAVSAIYSQIVPADRLVRVQGINQTINSVLLLLSPAVGGIVLGTLGIVWTFLVDVVTAALAVFVLARIRVETLERREGGSVLDELRQGFAYCLGHRLLRLTTIYCGMSFFLFTPAMVLTPLMIERTFGGEVWMLTANELAWSVGSIAGGVFVSLRGAFRNKARVIAVCIVAYGVLFGLLGVAGQFWLYLALMGAAGFFIPLLVTAQTVLVQENTAPEMQGRVFSIGQIISHSAMPLAILLFGPLADAISVQSIMVVTGVMLAALGGVFWRIGHG